MVLLEKPEDFKPKFTAAGCFMLCSDEILLLLRQDHKPQGGTWGTPGGKVEYGESPVQAVVREMLEETRMKIEERELRELPPTYVRMPELDFVYLMFLIRVTDKPPVTLDPTAHKQFAWVKLTEVTQLPFIHGLDEHLALLQQQLAN